MNFKHSSVKFRLVFSKVQRFLLNHPTKLVKADISPLLSVKGLEDLPDLCLCHICIQIHQSLYEFALIDVTILVQVELTESGPQR